MHLDFHSELAPDLEWMLQSGQVPKDVLLQALLQEHYAPVYRLALSLLDDESCARRAARKTFTDALFELHAYRGPNGVRPWLYSILVRACRAEGQKLARRRAMLASLPLNKHTHLFGDSLPENEFDAALWLAMDELAEAPRLLLLLSDLHGWGIEAVAALQQSGLQETQEGLRQARLDVLTAAWAAPGQMPSSEKATDDRTTGGSIQRSLQRRWSWREIPPEEIDHVFHQINHQLGGTAWRRKGLVHLREWSFVLLAGLAALAILWGASLVEPALQENDEISAPTPDGLRPTQTEDSDGQAAQPTYVVVTPTATFEALPAPAFYTVTDQDLLAFTQEEALEGIAQKLGTTATSLAEFNRLTLAVPLQSGQVLAIPEQIPESKPPLATPVAPTLRLAPLDDSATSQEVRTRLNLSRNLYKTLWLDATSMDFGPLNYNGPPRRTRVQIWLGEQQTLILSGLSRTWLPELAMLAPAGQDEIYIAHPAAGQPWYEAIDKSNLIGDPQVAQMDQILRAVLDNSNLDPLLSLRVAGSETVAGQETLLMEVFGWQELVQERFWLDSSANLVLMKQVFGGDRFERLLHETVVEQIAYDIDFPQVYFDPQLPWRGGYAADFSGAPITDTAVLAVPDAPVQESPFPENQTPQQGLDIATSPLSFVYPQDFDPDLDFTATTRVYAGEALAGELDFGNPWTMRCERSPNGRYLAYVPHPGSDNKEDGSLRVVDLLDPQLQETFYLDDYLVTEFAMSPNSFFLAFFARSRNKNEPGVLGIMDLGNGVMKPLFPTGSARSIAWSPTGAEVAAIVKYSAKAFIEQVYVIDVTSADGVYQRVYSEWLDEPPGSLEDAPFWQWGVPFPATTGGFSECANAPSIEE